MALEARDATIIAQNSATAAATIYAAEIAAFSAAGQVTPFDESRYEEIRQAIFGKTLELAQNAHDVGQVTQAFPGATVQAQPAPQVPAQPAPQGPVSGTPAGPAPVPPSGGPVIPQAQPGNSVTDQKWIAYFNAPQDYYDNRGNKKNPNSPDFKHKQTGEGLWLDGKYPAPQWVLQRFGMA